MSCCAGRIAFLRSRWRQSSTRSRSSCTKSVTSISDKARPRTFLPDPDLTFAEVLEANAHRDPEHPAFHEVTFAGREPHARPLTLSCALARIRTAACSLAERGVSEGDRVLLCVSRPDVF